MQRIALSLGLFLAAAAWAGEGPWVTSFSEAADEASREDKLVLMDFTGSDWCGWCKRLDAEVLSNPQFLGYASSNLVLLQVDFPVHHPQSSELKDANRALQKEYGVHGYPTIVIAKPDGHVLWTQTGYVPGGPKIFIDAANQCRRAVGLPVSSPAPPAPAPVAKLPVAPARPPLRVEVATVQPPVPLATEAGPKLQGIIYSSSHPVVVLDGWTCAVGESVNGARVVKIEKDSVTVDYQGQVRLLKMN